MPRKASIVEERKKPLAEAPKSDEWSRRQRVTSTCAFCGESVEAFVPEGVAWFAEHRRTKHPNVPEPKRQSGGHSKIHFVGGSWVIDYRGGSVLSS